MLGTGKSLICQAVLREIKGHATFFHARAEELNSKWLGEGEKILSTLFDGARKCAPSVIVIGNCNEYANCFISCILML